MRVVNFYEASHLYFECNSHDRVKMSHLFDSEIQTRKAQRSFRESADGAFACFLPLFIPRVYLSLNGTYNLLSHQTMVF